MTCSWHCDLDRHLTSSQNSPKALCSFLPVFQQPCPLTASSLMLVVLLPAFCQPCPLTASFLTLVVLIAGLCPAVVLMLLALSTVGRIIFLK